MWLSPFFVHQLISGWHNAFEICSCTLATWTIHSVLRNGLSYSLLRLRVNHSFQESALLHPNLSQFTAIVKRHFSSHCSLIRPHNTRQSSRDYKLPLCNFVCPVAISEILRWNPMTWITSVILFLNFLNIRHKIIKKLLISSCILYAYNIVVRIILKGILKQPISMAVPLWTTGRRGLRFLISLEEWGLAYAFCVALCTYRHRAAPILWRITSTKCLKD